jgi:hypothetical protein
MNRTIEKALAQLTKEEREAIKTTCADQNEPADKSLLSGGYRRDRHERIMHCSGFLLYSTIGTSAI